MLKKTYTRKFKHHFKKKEEEKKKGKNKLNKSSINK